MNNEEAHVIEEAELEPAASSKGIDWDYWFDRETWSSYMAFLLLTGGLLVVALPTAIEIRQVSLSTLELQELFSTIFILLFGIFAMSLGQAEISWGHRLSTLQQFLQILSRLGLSLMLVLPYWITFLMSITQSPASALLTTLHLAMFGFVMALFGWRLSLTHLSEIFQFNVKYLTFFAFLVATFFWTPIQFLNPIWPLQDIVDGVFNLFTLQIVGFYLVWIGAGVVLVYSIMNRSAGENSEGAEDGNPLS